jgi:hypothetical protein
MRPKWLRNRDHRGAPTRADDPLAEAMAKHKATLGMAEAQYQAASRAGFEAIDKAIASMRATVARMQAADRA